MVRRNIVKIIAVTLAGLLAILVLATVPALAADDETSMQAQVKVLPADGLTYGARVTGSWNVWWPWWALGEPDGRGASVFLNGWLIIHLKNEVTDADTVVVHATNLGWWPSNLKVWVSADGRKWWKSAGNARLGGGGYESYEFTGNFGNVKYIKVQRNGGPWSWAALDAVGAKGGDNGNHKKGK